MLNGRLTLALLCVLLLAVPSVADLWVSEQLPFDADPGTSIGFALDASGTPGFTFRNYTGVEETSGVYYGYRSEDTWTSEIIQSGYSTGAANSLVYNGSTPHIVYGAGSPTDLDLTFATGGPGSWSTDTIADTSQPRHSQIVLDSNGDIGVSWLDQDTDQLGYVYHDGSAWNTPETVDGQPYQLAGMETLLPDTVENASIIFSRFDGSFYNLPTLAERQSGGSWDLDTISSEDAGGLAGILTDDGQPALCYVDGWDGGIYYTEFNGTTWDTEMVVDFDPPMATPDRRVVDMARDDWGNIHLAYFNPDTQQVEYRYRPSGGSWADTDARTLYQGDASWVSLNLDGDQAPWFSYYANDEEQLHYGQGNAVPEPTTTALFAVGLLSAVGFVRRNRKTSNREQS